ncbi:MAG: DNA repair exonuclease [Blautia sp.]|nr:DNA repair exonuclease [Blautia sp.]
MRFIHLADVHLGAVPDKGWPWSSKRGEEIWETFRRVIAYIRENPVDLLFIAGDLFHRQPLLRELKEVNYLFTTIPDTRIYMIAGNHDYIRREGGYRGFAWAENVTFFMEEKVTCVKDPLLPVYVYGFSFHHREIRQELLQGLAPMEGEGLHILLAHGGDLEHVPMNIPALSASGFDYLALGHIHKPELMIKSGAGYSGSPEPLDRSETGQHGFIEGWLENERLRVRLVPFACRSYEQIVVTLNEESTQGSVEDMVAREIIRKGKENIYQIHLRGERAPELLLLPERFKSLGNVLLVEDATRPLYDLELLQKQYWGTLVGDYIDYFSGRALTPVEEKALYYGLQALLETSR